MLQEDSMLQERNCSPQILPKAHMQTCRHREASQASSSQSRKVGHQFCAWQIVTQYMDGTETWMSRSHTEVTGNLQVVCVVLTEATRTLTMSPPYTEHACGKVLHGPSRPFRQDMGTNASGAKCDFFCFFSISWYGNSAFRSIDPFLSLFPHQNKNRHSVWLQVWYILLTEAFLLNRIFRNVEMSKCQNVLVESTKVYSPEHNLQYPGFYNYQSSHCSAHRLPIVFFGLEANECKKIWYLKGLGRMWMTHVNVINL